MTTLSEDALRRLNTAVAAIDDNLARRFFDPAGVLYDYAGLNGEVLPPTPEECAANRPNALAWWSPIENGGFFNGDYLAVLLDRYRLEPSEKIAATIRKLAAGLYRLQDICAVPGMIARGIGADGACHYPASSNDQIIPWLLGLWRYQESGIPDADEAADCRERLLRQIGALEANHWTIPGDKPGFERGSLLHGGNDLERSLAAIHFVFVNWIRAELAGDDSGYVRAMAEPLDNGKTRLEVIAEGITEIAFWQPWFMTHCQYALRELRRRDPDAARRGAIGRGMARTAESAARLVPLFREFDPAARYGFTPDWRLMLPAWKEQADCADAQKVAYAEIRLWDEISPAIREEKRSLMSAAGAACLVLYSGEAELIERTLADMLELASWPDYGRLHYAGMLFSANFIGEILSAYRAPTKS